MRIPSTPRTGYPVQHSILSATVIAKDCMSADAYATAFMVMGLEEAERVADAHPDIDACFIYTDEEGKLQTLLNKRNGEVYEIMCKCD